MGNYVKSPPVAPGEVKRGRPKGVRNKRTEEIMDILSRRGIDLIGRLQTLMEDGDLTDRDRAWILLELMQYCYPKRGRVDVVAHDGSLDTITLDITHGDEDTITITSADATPKANRAIDGKV